MAGKLAQISNQQRIVAGVLALVLVVIFYTKVYAPLQGKINETKETVDKKEAELVDMKRKAKRLDKLEKEFQLLEEKLKLTEKKLPKTKELPEFIRIITKTAAKYGMSVDTLKVYPVQSSQYYDIHKYQLQLISDYHTFGRLFTEIVQMDRIFNIENVVLNSAASSDPNASASLSATFNLVTYTGK